MSEHAKPSLRQTLLRHAAQYSVGIFLGMVVSIGRAGVSARYLPAEQIGYWIALQLLVNYAANLHFGTLFGMFRSIPIKLASGDVAGAEEEKRTAFSFISVVVIVGTVLATVAAPKLAPQILARYIFEAIGLSAVTLLKSAYTTVFKAEKRFGELALSGAIGAFLGVGTIIAIPRFGLDALICGMTAQTMCETGVLAARGGIPKFGFPAGVLRTQLRVGVVTLVTNVGVTALMSIDRTVMLQVFGTTAAGLYYIGANIVLLVPVIATVPASVLTPHFFERVGKNEDLRSLVEKPVMLMSYGFSWVVAAGLVAIAPAVHLLWPHLAGGITAAKLALVGTIPIVLVGPVSNVYYAVDRQKAQVVVLLTMSAATYLAAMVGAHVTHDISGAAGGAALGLFAYYTASLGGAFWLVSGRTYDGLLLACRSLAPLAWALLLVAVTDFALGRVWPSPSLVRGVSAEFLVLFGMAPWLWRALSLVRGRS